MNKWTKFFDRSSGGSEKTEWSVIFIELPEDEAVDYFENRFGIDPHNVTCDRCGSDFSVYEVEELSTPSKNVLIINNDEILKTK